MATVPSIFSNKLQKSSLKNFNIRQDEQYYQRRITAYISTEQRNTVPSCASLRKTQRVGSTERTAAGEARQIETHTLLQFY